MTDHIDTRPSEPWESGVQAESHSLGVAGGIARFFINSPLSPLLYIAMFLLGLLGLFATPRQEDPQISVPMVDLFVQYPGAEPEQVAALAVQPLERLMFEIEGVKHVYSAVQRGQGVVTVQFEVGEDMEPSLVKVNDKLDSNKDRIPSGVMPPLVKAKGIDDVPVVTITLWSEKDYNGDGIPDVDDSQLRRLAQSVLQRVKEIPDTGNSFVVGGRAEQVIIEVYPERVAGYGVSLGQVAQAIRSANSEQMVGGMESGGTRFSVVTGAFLKTVDDIKQLQVGVQNGLPVYVYNVADVRQGPEDAAQMVAYYTGAAAPEGSNVADSVPAVTIAVAKKKGSNGVEVAKAVIERVESLRGRMIPDDIHISVTRDYGKSADQKVKDLIFKLFMATGFVVILVWMAFRAMKPAIVVLLVIPVVLLFTILMAWMLGFTIDRVSLFALIFSIGILVDDAIVVVENVYRRWLEKGDTDVATAVDAVREVGNPTILATFTVIGALLPMGFVTGMMGPYMMPIPVLGSVAMVISLFAAFVFTPWLAIHPWLKPSMHYLETAEKREHKEAQWLEGLYRRILIPMIEDKRKARMFKLGMWLVFLVMCSFFYFKLVAVKMLPLDNKPEFSVVLDMPEGTALVETGNLAHTIANRLRKMPEVTAAQIYVGTARPFDFNGMVRHYYLRQQPWQAEIQLQLVDKRERKRSSHQIAVDARDQVTSILQGTTARFSVVEMPPGPPVLQSVVAEVHHEDAGVRRKVAMDLTEIFGKTESLRDVDNYMREPYDYWHFEVNYEKAQRRGISVEQINGELAMAMGGYVLGDVKQRAGHEPTNIVIQVPLAERSQISRLGDILMQSPSGTTVPLRELGRFERRTESDVIYHKDLRPVEYVVADVGGRLGAPVYGMLQVQDKLHELGCATPDGGQLCDNIYWTGPPPGDNKASIEWAGEWTVTYETFRDMGIAFGAALVLIYILVVWEFGNFRIPALIMAPIPLTLLGIIPAHAVFFMLGWGGEFTATSMIGWIALAGIIVRNSILLVDFSVHQVQQGATVVDAVITSCTTRTRPILITALALVCGSSVIFFDPIFQGMAISLASGVLVSTVLTLVVIPLGCVNAAESLCEVAGGNCTPPETGGSTPAGRFRVKRDPIWVRAWGGVATVLIAAVSAVQMLLEFIGRTSAARRQRRMAAEAEATVQAAAAAAAGLRTPVADVDPVPSPDLQPVPTEVAAPAAKPAAEVARPVRKAAVAASPAAGGNGKSAVATTTRKKAATRKVAVKTKAVADPVVTAPSEPVASAPAAASVKPGRPKPAPKHTPKAGAQVAVKTKTAADPLVTAPSEPVAPAPAAASVKPGRPKPAPKHMPKAGAKKVPARKATAEKRSGPRRGIQLKSIGGPDDNGLA